MPEYDPRIKAVIHALEARPQLRTSQLAALVDLSPTHLERLFKKHLGISIRKFSAELGLQKAMKLLKTTFRSVKEIRNETGIPDASNFVRYFKERFGLSPSAYRKASDVAFDGQMHQR
jgi:transcriptional regulator GlxA family with amidase domain